LANVYYPGRKIIVWAASSHIARDTEVLASPTGGRPYATGWTVHMGTEAYRVLGPDMYAIGFTAGAGRSGRAGSGSQPLPAMLPGSLEEHFARTGHHNAFLDFRNRPAGGDWLKNVFTRPFGYQDLGGDWTRVLDGMIYTGEMVPSTLAGR
ncbi:MAG TPA: erythromycin esterase family protein, partial [Longimicrobium sp.]